MLYLSKPHGTFGVKSNGIGGYNVIRLVPGTHFVGANLAVVGGRDNFMDTCNLADSMDKHQGPRA